MSSARSETRRATGFFPDGPTAAHLEAGPAVPLPNSSCNGVTRHERHCPQDAVSFATSIAAMTRVVGSIALILIGCGNSLPPASSPFAGKEDASWFAFDVPITAPRVSSDYIVGFESSARDAGCRTSRLFDTSHTPSGGEMRRWYGTSADCVD